MIRNESGYRPLALSSSALVGWSPEEICAACADAGLDGVEWGVGPRQVLQPHDVKLGVADLQRAGNSAGLLCSGVSAHDDNALLYPAETWKWLAALAAELGAPHVRVYAPPLAPSRIESAWNELRDRLSECSTITAEAGVRLLIEPAPTTMVPGPVLASHALAHLEENDVGVVYDPGSLAREGWVGPHLAVSLLGPLLRHVHVKNVSPTRESSVWRWHPATLEAGIVDWDGVLEALDAVGYRDWFVLDHLSAEISAEVLRSDVARLRQLAHRDADG
jgi:Sugar phosphate isomerases/epimerases